VTEAVLPGSESAGATALEALLGVQTVDTATDQLRHRRARLPEIATLAGLEERLAGNAAAAAELDGARGALEARLAELAEEVSGLVGRSTRIDDRLRAGEVASFRDQEAMATEMGSLGRRREELDDEQLVVMEAIEELEGELNGLAAERAVVAREVASLRVALGSKEAAIDTEIATIAIRRADLAAEVPTELLDEYERLRLRLDGVGAARLVNGSCNGCHLAVSAAELDQIRHSPAGEVVHCAQCGRILVA
jgi:hypothetical protein